MQTPDELRRSRNLPTSLSCHRNEYEKQKKLREERFQKLQKERERILHEREHLLTRIKGDGVDLPPSRMSDISTNAAVNRARTKIPQYEDKVRNMKDEEQRRKRQLSRPYKGEMGIGSYEPWQLEDFYFVRDFVQSWVDEALEYIVFEPIGATREAVESFAEEFQRELEIEQSELKFGEAIRGEGDSILEEAIEELLQDVTDDCIIIHMHARQVITSILLDTVMPEDADDETQSQVAGAFQQMKKERTKWPGVWRHTQKFYFVGDTTEKPETADEDTFDGTVLSFDGIIPYDDTPNNELSPIFRTYRDAESSYWMGYVPITSSLPLPRRYKGVSCTALSSDHSLLAIGSEQGDIAVWDLTLYPPRVLRASRGNAAIKHIQWSLDSSQILSLNSQGVIQLWSLQNTLATTNDIKGFEPVEQNIGFKTSDLVNVLTLEPRDLRFTEGSLKSLTKIIVKPTFVAFHPSLSFLGKQQSLMVGMATGGILKLNLKLESNLVAFPKVEPSNSTTNKISKGIEAELFKSHKQPIRLIEFVNDSVSMVTVDETGYIYLWEYSEDHLSGFGWFTPLSSYLLDMTKITYHPASGTTEKVEFIDKVHGTGRIKELNRQDMVKKRKEMQKLINSLHFGRPWKTEDVDVDKVTHVYAPRNVPDSGATFHHVTYYRETKVLAQYATQLYKPERIQCTKMSSCQVDPSRSKLAFALLYQEIPPKDPHVSFVTINIKTMRVDRNVIEFPLDETEYKQCKEGDCCGVDISKVIDATGSQYIVSNVCGNINGFSVTTGTTVMASSQENWVGCHLRDEQALTFTKAKVMVACPVSGMVVLFYAPRQNTLTMLHLKDKIKQAQRQSAWSAFCNLRSLGPVATRMQHGQVLQRKLNTVTGLPDRHVEYTIQTLLLDMIDKAIQSVDGPFTDDEAEAYALENRQLPFIRGR